MVRTSGTTAWLSLSAVATILSVTTTILSTTTTTTLPFFCEAKLADRSRLVKHRQATGQISGYHDNGHPMEGQSYRSRAARTSVQDQEQRLQKEEEAVVVKEQRQRQQERTNLRTTTTTQQQPSMPWHNNEQDVVDESQHRHLSSQLSGCCYTYDGYTANNMCALYGQDCESGETPSHDSGDDDCSQKGLSFIGLSFSVNTASGNPYSYQLCDQFPMENIIDRNYEYVMSMDEDGWLVGGGYKTFDYSGKMPCV